MRSTVACNMLSRHLRQEFFRGNQTAQVVIAMQVVLLACHRHCTVQWFIPLTGWRDNKGQSVLFPNTVKPRDFAKCPLNRGCPLNEVL